MADERITLESARAMINIMRNSVPLDSSTVVAVAMGSEWMKHVPELTGTLDPNVLYSCQNGKFTEIADG